jgi:hypothetical protein
VRFAKAGGCHPIAFHFGAGHGATKRPFVDVVDGSSGS